MGKIHGRPAWPVGWYPDVQAAIVVPINSNGNLDPTAVVGELAAELLPWTRPTPS